MHEGGFRIELDYQNHWFFKRPDGGTVPACGYQLQDMTDNDSGELSNLFNIPSAEGFFTAVISTAVNSPPV